MAPAPEPLHGVSWLADLLAGRVHLEAAKGVDGVEREQRLAQLVPIRGTGLLDCRLEHVARAITAARVVTGFMTVLGLVFLGKFMRAGKLERVLPLGIAHDTLGVEAQVLAEVR